MEGKKDSDRRFAQQTTKRVKKIIIQNLLTLLSLNSFAATTTVANLQKDQVTTNYSTNLPLPISIKSTFLFMDIVASAPIVVPERVSVTTTALSERRQHVVWFAESHVDWGIRYSWGKASLDDGFDCSGFVKYILNYFDYQTSRCSSDQFKDGTQIPIELARPGDLVFFGSKSEVTHVAMVVSNDEEGLVVVHSTCSHGVHKENISHSTYWKPKLKDIAVNIIGF